MDQLPYCRHRFPPAVIQHAIWLYIRFTLSYRDVEDLLAERGLEVSYETVRRWVLKFGPGFARRLRRSRPRSSDRWHLDEIRQIVNALMYILSTGCQWRALPQDLPPRSTVPDYFSLWSVDGTLHPIHHSPYLPGREQAGAQRPPTPPITHHQTVQ